MVWSFKSAVFAPPDKGIFQTTFGKSVIMPTCRLCGQVRTPPILIAGRPMPISVQGESIIISVPCVMAQTVPICLFEHYGYRSLMFPNYGDVALSLALLEPRTECIWNIVYDRGFGICQSAVGVCENVPTLFNWRKNFQLTTNFINFP